MQASLATDALTGYGMKSSMSRKGNCWDKARTESLWGHRDPRSTARCSHLKHATLADAVALIGKKRPTLKTTS